MQFDRKTILKGSVALAAGALASTAQVATVAAAEGETAATAALMDDVAGAGVIGRLITWRDVASAHLIQNRHVSILLPQGYDAAPRKRWPVIYMTDGQNLFDPRLANTGVDWGVDEALAAGVAAGRFEGAIVVATWSTARRFEDYSPWADAPAYARFLTDELKPRIDREFRTLMDRDNTFAMGSSMGGLLAMYLVRTEPATFGACGCLSTHFPLSEAMIARYAGRDAAGMDETLYIDRDIAAGIKASPGTRYFFDYGTKGLDAEYGPSHARVRGWLMAQEFVEGRDFLVREYPGADHNEASWRARIGDQLAWLLARRAP